MMMASSTILRIHPALGVSRCGNASGYILSPETAAGMPQPDTTICGGLPIKPETEADTITDQDLRDPSGRLKPQAQRFRIYAYATAPDGSYPYQGEVSEVVVGSMIDGKKVESIAWQVHMANKKANSWIIPEDRFIPEDSSQTALNNGIGGLAHYANGNTPPKRNIKFGGTDEQAAEVRRTSLVLDSGPKIINSVNGAGVSNHVAFDANSPCEYLDDHGVAHCIDYPVSFPDMHFTKLYEPTDEHLDSMGGMETDAQGRLLVIGGKGYAAAWYQNENKNPNNPNAPDQPFKLNSDIDNDGWFDDAGDGPVTAALTFSDGTVRKIDVPAWCICADPAYAPQIRNVVSVWDETYNAWLRSSELNLDPQIFNTSTGTGTYNPSYQPGFNQDVWPLFRAAHLQMFTTDLNKKALGSHRRLDSVSADKDPATYLNVKNFIRNPSTDYKDNDLQTGAPLMPLSLGDTGASFLTVTHTQYFFLEQWYAKKYTPTETLVPTAGEALDRNTLSNLLGGRFSPGIDLTFIVRDSFLYQMNWKDPTIGPFRIGAAPLKYDSAQPGKPFLTVGYTPERGRPNTVEPGDLCKFMALPWHTDYNSCATHQPSPNPERNTTMFWSWPAQRPVSVYTYGDYQKNNNSFFAKQQFSVRGAGTQVTLATGPNPGPPPESTGRYQERVDMVKNWMNIGVVIQGPAIQGYGDGDPELFLEVASCLKGPSDVSQPWPVLTTDKVYPVPPSDKVDSEKPG
jgi:hypothetical protein